MGYQFAHIEGYGKRGAVRRDPKTGRSTRQWSASECAAEAMRQDGACSHVAAPKPPVPLFGCTPAEAAAKAEAWADQATDAAGRKYRDTSPALLAGVVSMERGDSVTWEAYKASMVEHLQERYGDRLLSVVEHMDEAHPHLHFYAVPRPGERFDVLHPGRAAAAEAAAQGLKKGEQMKAYADAMRTWQDELHAACGAAHGLTRIGPGRQRLSRGEWQAQKAQAEALARVEQVAEAAHRRGWAEGKREGRAEAKAEAAAPLARVGDAVGGLAARLAGRWHKPTQQAEADAEKARKRAAKAADEAKATENRRKALEGVLSTVNRDLDTANAVAKAAKAEAAAAKAENEALRAEVRRLRPAASRTPGYQPTRPRV